jgi:hypothetical protein
VTSCGEEDLEYLFRPDAAQIGGTERAPTVFDRERSEEPDLETAGGVGFSDGLQRRPR